MIPISFSFIALGGLATQAAGKLRGLKPLQTGSAVSWESGGNPTLKPMRTGAPVSWEGSGNTISKQGVGVPITDKSYWADRYVYCDLTFENEKGERLVMNDAVVSLSRSRNIVSTRMVGMDGTVKEYISEGDYDINIVVGIVAVENGVIVDKYPEDGIRQVKAFLDRKTALGVHSVFLDLFDVNSIVVKSFSVTQNTASNYQVISISAVSDEEYNIYSEYK